MSKFRNLELDSSPDTYETPDQYDSVISPDLDYAKENALDLNDAISQNNVSLKEAKQMFQIRINNTHEMEYMPLKETWNLSKLSGKKMSKREVLVYLDKVASDLETLGEIVDGMEPDEHTDELTLLTLVDKVLMYSE